jgi:competence protein CoiA
MKYAMSNGEKREAQRGLIGKCPICDVPVKPRCGKIRVHHWYHPPGHFDHRWEPETPWHRNWKNLFPKEWQEVLHRAENGERHLADVKTARGQVLEFQHSEITEEERSSREAIYGEMCWVVDGSPRKNHKKQFVKALELGRVVQRNPLTIAVPTASSMLLRKWEASQKVVVFDFGEQEASFGSFSFATAVLWMSPPARQNGETVLQPIYRSGFVDITSRTDPPGSPNRAMEPSRVQAPPRLAPRFHRRF